jgi:hypothetical protein
MFSISSDPVKKALTKAPGNPAMTIIIALRKTWPYSTRFSVRPFMRAVSTYCLRISSRNEFLVRKVEVANEPSTSADTGSTMCQR